MQDGYFKNVQLMESEDGLFEKEESIENNLLDWNDNMTLTMKIYASIVTK